MVRQDTRPLVRPDLAGRRWPLLCATRISRTPCFTFYLFFICGGMQHRHPQQSMYVPAVFGSARSQLRLVFSHTPYPFHKNDEQAKRAELRAAWRQRKRDDRKRKALWYEALDLAVSQLSTPPSSPLCVFDLSTFLVLEPDWRVLFS